MDVYYHQRMISQKGTLGGQKRAGPTWGILLFNVRAVQAVQDSGMPRTGIPEVCDNSVIGVGFVFGS